MVDCILNDWTRLCLLLDALAILYPSWENPSSPSLGMKWTASRWHISSWRETSNQRRRRATGCLSAFELESSNDPCRPAVFMQVQELARASIHRVHVTTYRPNMLGIQAPQTASPIVTYNDRVVQRRIGMHVCLGNRSDASVHCANAGPHTGDLVSGLLRSCSALLQRQKAATIDTTTWATIWTFFSLKKINKLTEYAIPADYWVIGANYTHLSAQ